MGGLALFIADDGYAAGPPEFVFVRVFAALACFCRRVLEVPGCTGQLFKFKGFSKTFNLLTNYPPMLELQATIVTWTGASSRTGTRNPLIGSLDLVIGQPPG